MENKKKPVAWLLVGAMLLWQVVIQPIWNLNLERLAESRDLDQALARGGGDMIAHIASIAAYLPSSFGVGFATGALIFAYWDAIWGAFRRDALRRRNVDNPGPEDNIEREMCLAIGSITPYFNQSARTLTLDFTTIVVGNTNILVDDVKGEIEIFVHQKKYRSFAAHFDNRPHEEFVGRGYYIEFSVSCVMPEHFWSVYPDIFIWKPSPLLHLDDLEIRMTSKEGISKRLKLWDSMQMSAGYEEVRSVER